MALSTQPTDQELQHASYEEIIDFILPRYHQRHREQLAELITLAEKVENRHGDRGDCPKGLAKELQLILADLSNHMMKEEQVLFPMIKMGNYAMARMPIQMMKMEHVEHSDHIGTLKALTNNFVPPADACTSWQTLYAGVAEFVEDLTNHIHTEDDILFYRVEHHQ